jgi:hypothetical protein
MKKGILVLVLGVLVLASCKKSYSCVCVDATLTSTVESHKGKDAADACSDASSVIPLKACTPQ